MSTVPQWVPPLPSRADLDNQRPASETTKSILAEGSAIPIIVGEAQVGGKVFAIDYNSSTSTWTVGVAWCLGEVESVVSTYLNGAAPVAGVTVNSYTGTTTQTADALLSAAITSYSDTLVLSRPGGNVGVCYSVFQYTDTHYSDFPQFVAQIQGLKTNGGAYSANPVHALKYLIEDAVIGLDGTTNASSFTAAATTNDDEVTTGVKRREIGLVIDNVLTFDKWVKILASYCSCWVNKQGNTYYLTPDRPRSTDATLTSADWAENSFSMTFADKDNTPTAVEIVYTDTTETIWRERTVRAELTGVSSGTVPERVSRVQMPGVTRYAQAVREANERLNKLNLTTSCAFDAFDEQLGLQLGDVISVTRGTHLSNKLFRITAPPRKVFGGGVRIQATEYDSAVYSNSNPTDPTFGVNSAFLGDGTTGGDWTTLDNVPANLSSLSGTEDIDNADVNISVSGTTIGLTGAGATTYTLDQTNVGLSGVQSNADQTSSNTAAGIAGQGALATQNTVDLTTTASGGVSGTLPNTQGGTGITNFSNSTHLNANTTATDVGLGNVANVDTTNAANITSGTLPAGRGGTGITNFSNSTHLNSNTTATQVGLGNVANERQITIFRQAGTPTALAVGDLWVDTDDGNKLYRASATGTANWDIVGAGTSAANISAGTLPAGRGGTGITNFSNATHLNSNTTSSDVGLGNVPNVDTTNAGNISSGTLPAARGGTGITNFSNATHLNANTSASDVGLGNVDNHSSSTILGMTHTGAVSGNVTGSVNGVSAATVQAGAADGAQQQAQASLLPQADDSEWSLGEVTTSGKGIWTRNGDGGDENTIVLEEGPHGDVVRVWKSISTDGSGADGGFSNGVSSSDYFTVDSDVVYRFSCFVKQSQSDGTMYFGMYNKNSSGTNIGVTWYDGDTNVVASTTNPYWYSGNLDSFGDWYLFVGHINPSGSSINSGKSGLYRVSTGERTTSFEDFRFNASAATFQVRTYLFYSSTDSGTIARWAHPRVDRLDRAYPSIQQLMAGAENSLNTNINYGSDGTGTLPNSRGGTGITNFSNSTHLNANTTASQVGLGNVANVDTTNANNITSGTLPAARGGTGLTSITTLQNTNVTTYTVDKSPSAVWSALSADSQVTGPPAPYDVTITWLNGAGTSLGTTVLRMSYSASGTSISTTSHTTQSNSASASVSLNSTNTSALKVSTVTKNSVTVTLTSSVINGISWSFSK